MDNHRVVGVKRDFAGMTVEIEGGGRFYRRTTYYCRATGIKLVEYLLVLALQQMAETLANENISWHAVCIFSPA